MKDFGIPIKLDPAVPEGTMFLVPPDMSAAIDAMSAAEVMRAHGIIDEQTYLGVCGEATEIAVKAAKERRVAVIKNLA